MLGFWVVSCLRRLRGKGGEGGGLGGEGRGREGKGEWWLGYGRAGQLQWFRFEEGERGSESER
jgi:hypothetical protein